MEELERTQESRRLGIDFQVQGWVWLPPPQIPPAVTSLFLSLCSAKGNHSPGENEHFLVPYPAE